MRTQTTRSFLRSDERLPRPFDPWASTTTIGQPPSESLPASLLRKWWLETLDALYSQTPVDEADFNLLDEFSAAAQTIPKNLSALVSTATDPLGLDLGELRDTTAAADNQAVELNTIAAMRSLFDGKLGAFSYLLFILLYMPCVATIGVIYKELGPFWAVFSTAWSVVVAYAAAVVCYQIGSAAEHPLQTLFWCITMLAIAGLMFTVLIRWGIRRGKTDTLIPVMHVD